ncbi:hypothetical protein DL765_008718 [Monosporascus sp. GIB2]|nr:hypothetical protein DL765_008718 [Monosporascus sp. GIB2]
MLEDLQEARIAGARSLYLQNTGVRPGSAITLWTAGLDFGHSSARGGGDEPPEYVRKPLMAGVGNAIGFPGKGGSRGVAG